MIRKIRKMIFIAAMTFAIGFTLSGCSTEESNKLDVNVREWVDPDTHVHYIYNGAGGVSVRYNTDGTIMHD